MSDLDTRIQHFTKMATDDPENELGHFSLGRALMEAGRFDQAIASFGRVIELNPKNSRAYQLRAAAMLRKGDRQGAIAELTRGVEVAHQRGDMMPRNEMIQMLKDLGAPVPDLAGAQTSQTVGEGQVLCQRCGRVGPKQPAPPFRNAQGREIQEKICMPCWREWLAMSTKVINELRLPLADPQAQKIYDQHMIEFLNLH